MGVGEHRVKGAGSDRTDPIRVAKIVLHPAYLSIKKFNDVALLLLEDSVEWSPLVQPACLPNPSQAFSSGVLATVAGWGKTTPKNVPGIATPPRSISTSDRVVRFASMRRPRRALVNE